MVDGGRLLQREVWDGRTMQTLRQAGSAPTIVLLGGCGVPHPMWYPVLDLLPGRSIVVLDRPGIGTPWPGDVPTLAAEVATIAELAAAESAPVVLVGHSMAGPHAEAATRLHPALIRGLVLVDPSVEWWPVDRPRSGNRRARVACSGYRRAAALVQRMPRPGPITALMRRIIRTALERQTAPSWAFDQVQMAELVGVFASTQAQAMALGELGAYRTQIDDLFDLRAAHAWPRTPTEVLTAMKGSPQAWFAAQGRLAELLAAQHRMVASGHNLMLGCPEAIAESVARVSR